MSQAQMHYYSLYVDILATYNSMPPRKNLLITSTTWDIGKR